MGHPLLHLVRHRGEQPYSNVTNNGVDDFLVASRGRNKAADAIAFNPLTPTTAYFDITGLKQL